MDVKDVDNLRVVDLQKELERRGLPKRGSKKELADRLKAVGESHVMGMYKAMNAAQ